MSWDGAAWSSPSVYYPAPAAGPVTAPVLPSLDCTSGPLCMIVDASGHVSTGDGTNWSSPLPLARRTAAPGRPGRPRARAPRIPDGRGVVPLTGPVRRGGQHRPHLHPAQRHLAGPAVVRRPPWGSGPPPPPGALPGRPGRCLLPHHDLVHRGGGHARCWTGTARPGRPRPPRGPRPWPPVRRFPVSIACPTVTLCAIVNGDAIVVRDAGKPVDPPPDPRPRSAARRHLLSDPSFCVAADDTGAVMVWNGSTWTGPQQVIPAATEYPGIGVSVSCSVAAVLHGHERRRRLRLLQRPRPGGPLTGPRRGRAQPAPTSSPVMPASMVTVRQLRVVAVPPVARSK